jgi:hypothetical protein
MGARDKLNTAYALGSLLTAALVGWAIGSWFAFFITAALLLSVNVYNGDIR